MNKDEHIPVYFYGYISGKPYWMTTQGELLSYNPNRSKA